MIRRLRGWRGEEQHDVIPDADFRVQWRPRSRELIGHSIGEFDPGSGRTLAACLTHASQGAGQPVTGERVRNT